MITDIRVAADPEPATPTIDPNVEPGTAPSRTPVTPGPSQPDPDPLTPVQPNRECDPPEGPCPFRGGSDSMFFSCDGVPDLTGQKI